MGTGTNSNFSEYLDSRANKQVHQSLSCSCSMGLRVQHGAGLIITLIMPLHLWQQKLAMMFGWATHAETSSVKAILHLTQSRTQKSTGISTGKKWAQKTYQPHSIMS